MACMMRVPAAAAAGAQQSYACPYNCMAAQEVLGQVNFELAKLPLKACPICC